MRELDEVTLVDCVFSETIDYVDRFFHENSDLELLGLGVLRAHVTARAHVVEDATDAARRHDALDVRWEPESSLPLPTFSGEMRVRPKFEQTELRLVGRYEPPLGPVGEVFDLIAGHAIAAGTARELLAAVKRFVEAARDADRAAYPSDRDLNARNPQDPRA